MKKLTFLSLLTMILCVLCVSASSDFIVWDFSDKADCDQWRPSPSTVTIMTNSGLYVTGSGNDMNLSLSPSAEINLEDYGFLAVVFANVSVDASTSGGSFQFYHWTDESSGNPFLSSYLSEMDGVQYITFDTKNGQHPNAQWSGKVRELRIDPMRKSNAREYLIVYAGLFKDQATFEAYKASNPVNAQKPYTVPPYVEETDEETDYIIWDFTNQSAVDQWIPSSSATGTATSNGLLFSGATDDLNFTYRPEGTLRLEDYPYVSIGYSGYTESGIFQLYHWTDQSSGNPLLQHNAISQGQEGELFYNMLTDAPAGSSWAGKVRELRLDPCRSDKGQRSGYIKYIALFPDMTSYNNFVTDNRIFNAGINNAVFSFAGKNCTIDYNNDSAIITTESKAVSFTTPAEFKTDSYPYMKIRVKNMTDADSLTMCFDIGSSQNKFRPATTTKFDISSNDTEFKEYIIDVESVNMASVNAAGTLQLTSSMWTGSISNLEFSFETNTNSSQKMYIDYIAFCESLAAAQSFTPPAGSETEQPAINTGATAPTWVFDTEEEIYNTNSSGISLSSVGNMMRITPTTNDPIIMLPIEPELRFNTEEFPYFAYRHRTVSTVSTASIYYTTSNLTFISPDSYTPITIKNNGTWQNIIVNVGDTDSYPNNRWNGICDYIRIDPINGTDLNADIYIDRIGFFRTKSEAYKFLSEGRSEPDYTKNATFIDKLYKVMVPEGNLFEGFDESDFVPVSTDPQGQGTTAVVLKTDGNGNTSPVPLSYVNSYNYTTYIATDPASYTLGYNDTSFTDTTNHWAKSHIDFVTSHEIMDGTSQNEFSPDMPMTRAMFITALGRMHGIDTAMYNNSSDYTDIQSDMYCAPYIAWAEENSIINCFEGNLFLPENAVTRLEIANIIADYINVFGYNTIAYDDTTAFSDLEELSENAVSAVEFVESLGILSGISGDSFDPYGITTRAEAAAVTERTVKAVLGVNTATTEYTPEYFQRDRLRIGAFGFSPNFSNETGMTQLRDLGVDLILASSDITGTVNENPTFNYADKYGIELFVTDFSLQENIDSLSDYIASYGEHPSFSGHFMMDEPGSDDFGTLSDLADSYSQQLPGKIPFINLLPMYANAAQLKYGANVADIDYYDPDPDLYREYCQMWFENFDVDYICTDIYPLNGTTGIENRSTWSTYGNYCESINQIATVARENNAEFWCCIQAWGWTNGKRTPTEGEYRWQCYTMLSYGCTSILLWSLTSIDNVYPSIFDNYTNSVNQSVYDDCAAVMWEMRRLSDTFIQYKNLGAFTLNCTSATPWLNMSDEYDNFDILSETVSSQPLLIGCFEKKEGAGHAFTVVNMTDLKDNSSAVFKFKTASPKTVKLYTKNDPVTLTPDSNGYYTISLQSCDGVFVTLD